jgi:hypothetical protein
MQACDTKTFQWRVGSLQSGAAHCLSATLIGATILLLALSFRGGIDRAHDATIVLRSGAHFFNAVCAILSTEKYGTGRYVCAVTAHRNMEAIGLGYEEATLARLGKGLDELGRETAFLNDALKKLFQTAPPAEDGGVTAIGWAMDAGYMDFVDLAFRIFGPKVESLYLTFFLFLAGSTTLACIQFYDRFLVLFSLLSFQYVLFFFLHETDAWEIYSFTNPRFLSILAVIPLLHALFLILYQVRSSGRAILLFLPQAALMAATGDFRATAYWTVIALMVFCVLLVGAARRQSWSYQRAVGVCWPALPIFLCMAAVTVFVETITDPRLVEMGGMKGHAFWQSIYYNLQLHPDWTKKYSDQHAGATGDEAVWVAVKAYRKRYHLESEPLTQISYEKQTRAVFFEFIRNDPWYFIELKYLNAATIVEVVRAFLSRVWASLPWPFLILAACTAVGLATRVRTRAESLSTLTWCTVTVVALVAIVAAPTWVTVVTIYAIADTGLVAATASFLAALWLAVSLTVLVTNGAALHARLKASHWFNRSMARVSAACVGLAR